MKGSKPNQTALCGVRHIYFPIPNSEFMERRPDMAHQSEANVVDTFSTSL